tara:strand:- start:22145 stop:22621 length:477 start_codon:yes stop_codon:yes gene_type:complete
MVTIQIDTIGDEKFIRGFNRYVAEMKDFSEVFEDISKYLFSTSAKIFKAQGDPIPFAPLSPKYKEWKARHFPGRPILVLRGPLKESLTAGSSDTIKNIGKLSMEWGTRVVYARRQHRAGRKPIQLTEPRKRVIARMIHQWAYDKATNTVPFHERQVKV